ncbi:hypothetical protein KGP36_08190 [Patescibacteria group bacterium]|nr:hypothetical protein [Patescibacteria group bacterium]MDE1941400.1 hypothetical protein [Patescibacteria group bacterium]
MNPTEEMVEAVQETPRVRRLLLLVILVTVVVYVTAALTIHAHHVQKEHAPRAPKPHKSVVFR